jgi:hypothetical protein
MTSEPFIVDTPGPAGVYGVFEDDGETGYLYIYNQDMGIVRHLHLYDRSPDILVQPEDVRVIWSRDLGKCAAVIWDQYRGIIDLANEREGRVWLTDRQTPGIADAEWLEGFQPVDGS